MASVSNNIRDAEFELDRLLKINPPKALELLKKVGINDKDDDGNTLLHWAAGRGHVNFINFLIENKAFVDALNNDLQTPLHLSTSGGHIASSLSLLRNHANPNAQDILGVTPLHNASEKEFAKLMIELLVHGANKNIQNVEGNTPMHISASRGDWMGLTILLSSLEGAADLTLRNNENKTIRDMAKAADHGKTVEVIDAFEKSLKNFEVKIADDSTITIKFSDGKTSTLTGAVSLGVSEKAKDLTGLTRDKNQKPRRVTNH